MGPVARAGALVHDQRPNAQCESQENAVRAIDRRRGGSDERNLKGLRIHNGSDECVFFSSKTCVSFRTGHLHAQIRAYSVTLGQCRCCAQTVMEKYLSGWTRKMFSKAQVLCPCMRIDIAIQMRQRPGNMYKTHDHLVSSKWHYYFVTHSYFL